MYGLNGRDFLIMAILDCGSADLSIIDNVEYDFYEIVEHFKEEGIPLSLENIVIEIFLMGIDDLKIAIKNKLEELRESGKSKKIIKKIEELNPDRDVTWYFNYLDTHIYLDDCEGTYRKYFSKEIDEIEDNMGFEFKIQED